MIAGFNFKKPLYLDENEVVLDLIDNHYIPVMYKRGNDWVRILAGDIIFDWLIYVKTAFRSYDPVKGEYGDGNLYSYQHGMAINMLNIVIGDKTRWIDLQASRQSGKHKLAP